MSPPEERPTATARKRTNVFILLLLSWITVDLDCLRIHQNEGAFIGVLLNGKK